MIEETYDVDNPSPWGEAFALIPNATLTSSPEVRESEHPSGTTPYLLTVSCAYPWKPSQRILRFEVFDDRGTKIDTIPVSAYPEGSPALEHPYREEKIDVPDDCSFVEVVSVSNIHGRWRTRVDVPK
ncbi:MAG: hypothetical protein NUW37_13740 [Planctomycetes bacterium]|nr:hypothetical protein [Planctomycetota bacterium]